MTKRFRGSLTMLSVLAVFMAGSGIFAQPGERLQKSENPGFVVDGKSPSGSGHESFLTGPQKGTPSQIGLAYLRANLSELGLTGGDFNDYIVTDQYTDAHNGVTHIYMRQRYQGIEVANGNISINIARDGSVINVGNSFVSNLAKAVNRHSPGRDAVHSLGSAARHLGLDMQRGPEILAAPKGISQEALFDDAGISQEPISAKLVYQPVSASRVRLAWQFGIYELSSKHLWTIMVDAENGEVLAQHDHVDHDQWGVPNLLLLNGPLPAPRRVTAAPRTTFSSALSVDGASYNVFAMPFESPSDGGRSIVVNPAHPIASPFGWHDTNGVAGPEFTITRGNNVHAYPDIDANNVADAGSEPDGGAGLMFDQPLDLSQAPANYRPAAVTNLFYWNNIIHDVFYGYGFNEISGNFQVNNYGRGPAVDPLGADDGVRAEAQDGNGTNNANFATNTDGNPPRMQMYVWNNRLPSLATVTINAASPIAGDYVAREASFGPTLASIGPLTADVVLALDPSNSGGPSTTDGCSPLTNAEEVAGNIALLDRGGCSSMSKVFNAQNAGAVAVVVANNVPGALLSMPPSTPPLTITIPSVMVSLPNGDLIKANLPLNATLQDGEVLLPSRDSDLDGGIIVHEYGHGISNRLTGGPSVANALNNQEQMGEGWSDWLGLVLTTHPDDTPETRRGVFTYLMFQLPDGNGARPTPYSTDMTINPSTYDTIKTAAVPHGVGYVWSTMLWEMYWNLVNKHGYNPDVYGNWATGGNNLAIQLVMDGMKLQPAQPGFVTGRDAILQADAVLTGGANQCEIWQAFAKRGLGVGASQGSSDDVADGVQAFNLPEVCVPTLSLEPVTAHYSDSVTLNASVSPILFSGLPVTGSVEFFIEGVSVGISPLAADGSASVNVSNDRPSGNYSITGTFTPSGPAGVNVSNAGPATLTVTKENAETSYTGDAFVTTAGPNINTAPVSLSANLVQEPDGESGDISLARVVFEFFKSTNMTDTPDVTVGNVPVGASENAATIVNLAADNWTVKVKVESANEYWTASPVGVSLITVAIGSTDRRVTGGGWVPDANSGNGRGNFGFTVSVPKNGNGNPKGNSVFAFRGLDGFDYIVKSTSLQGGSLVFLGKPPTNARFNGRATVQKIDRATGTIVESFGNYAFTVELHDGDLLNPRGTDAYGTTVLTNGGVLWHQVGNPNVPVGTGGGNVAIKATN